MPCRGFIDSIASAGDGQVKAVGTYIQCGSISKQNFTVDLVGSVQGVLQILRRCRGEEEENEDEGEIEDEDEEEKSQERRSSLFVTGN